MLNLKTILYLILLICVSAPLNAQKQEAFFVVSPHGHKSNIRDLLCTDKGILISAGFDKTIQLWDTKNKHHQGELRHFTGEGSEGMIYCMALSPNSRYLAIGGWFGLDDESAPLGDIRIFDLQQNKIVQVLKGLENAVFKICFSSDGNKVYAGDGAGFIKGWDLLTGKKTFQHQQEDDGISGLDENNKQLLFSYKSGNTYLMNLSTERIEAQSDLFLQKGYEPDEIKFAPDGNSIAQTGGKYILIYDAQLKKVQEIDNGDDPSRIRFSPNGDKFLVGSYTRGEHHDVNVYKLSGKQWNKTHTFSEHKQAVLAIAWLNNETCVTAGGEFEELVLWELKENGVKKLHTFMGVGSPLYAATVSDQSMYFARDWSANFGMSEYQFQFDMFLREIKKKIQLPKNENRPQTQTDDLYLTTSNGGNEIEEATSVLEINKKKKILHTIQREWWDGSRHNCYSFTPNNYILSSGSYGMMYAYDTEGKEVSRFIGHTGDIWSISVAKDRNWIITSGSDQTIKIWDLNDVNRKDKVENMPSIWKYCEDMQVADTYHQVFQLTKTTTFAQGNTLADWQNTINVLDKKGWPCEFLKNKLNSLQVKNIYPIASMFLSRDGEWIIWNEEGYFMSSKNGTQFVGYQLNQGRDKEAKFYPFEQFDLKYNRPDILLKSLNLADAGMIDIYNSAYKKRLTRMNLTEEDLASDLHAPEIKIIQHNFLENGKYQLNFSAFDEKYSLNRVNVFVNDVPVYGRKGMDLSSLSSQKIEKDIHFNILPGRNKIQISVLNNRGQESLKETFYVYDDTHEDKPKLYYIGLGVSNYEMSDFNLKFAAKDAEDLATTLSQSKAFSEVHQLTLTNEKVNKNSLDSLRNFLQSVQATDVVMVFIAGHGVLDKDLNYYFASHDLDFNDPAQNGISYNDIESLVDGIPAIRKLLIMDTCHSGELDKDDVEKNNSTEKLNSSSDIVFRNVGVGVRTKEGAGIEATNEVMKEMFSDLRRGAGATVIASAGGTEFAMESQKWQNGLFTYCFIQALQSQNGDSNKDGFIFVSELKTYIQAEVLRLSEGLQEPTTRTENLSMDYRIW